jgi:hypothetical protein
VKSKGVRLVSARIVIIHATINGTIIIFGTMETSFVLAIFRVVDSVKAASIKIAIEIS